MSTLSLDYLLERVTVDPSGCWFWKLSVNNKGYAIAKIDGRTRSVHKAAWVMDNGPVPDGKQLDHLCHTNDPACPGGPMCLHRRCVRSIHLEPVTSQVNCLRGLGIPAVNAVKVACIRSHPFTPENTYITASGSRDCRACRREVHKPRLRARQRAA